MFNPYNPYQNQVPMQMPSPAFQPAQMPMAPEAVKKVSGIAGAQAFPLAPDSSILLLDEAAPIVWFVKTDSAGYKTCLPYDISPHEEEKAAPAVDSTVQDLIVRVEKLEERFKHESDS